MKVYLAGKITGDPNYREKFAAAAKKLEERAGVTVISPAVTPEGLKKADYMRICFAMLESADTAVFLPDWEDILYRLRVIEACINKTDKRTLRIWKQLQQLLHLESEETE